MEKSILTPNRNPTYNMHNFVAIPVLTIGKIPQVWVWGYLLGLSTTQFPFRFEKNLRTCGF